MKKLVLVVAILFAASMTVAALIYKPRLSNQGEPVISAIPGTMATRPFRRFKLLEEPRSLKDFKFVDGEWKPASLADFQGKTVLLNIWATWCGPCREEMPTLDWLQASMGGPDFEVIALSIDQGGIAVVNDFYRELGLKALRVFVDPSGMAPGALNVLGLPTTLLIDRAGREVGRYVGPAEWDSPEMISVIRQQVNAPMAAKPSS
ncbi:MAG: TlpA disulfide reductase family protein [Acidiferrobacterales bacterium]